MQTILIADDDEGIRALIETTLEGPECRVLLAEDGETALALARRELPDLVILDWMMPKLTGPEIAERLHCDPLTAQIPIVLLTGMSKEENRQRGLATGALAYLIKPFSPLQLLHIVQQVLAEKGEADAPGREVAAAGGRRSAAGAAARLRARFPQARRRRPRQGAAPGTHQPPAASLRPRPQDRLHQRAPPRPRARARLPRHRPPPRRRLPL